MIITSTQNPQIKQIKRQMKDKSFAVLDNPKLILEAKNAGAEILLVIKNQAYTLKTDYGGQMLEVSESVFKSLAETENSQGVLAIVKLKTHELKPPSGNFLVMDGLQDPGNVGTLIRSALGANFMDIYLVDSVNLTNNKVIRSTMGAIFKTRIYQISKAEFLNEYKKWNIPLCVCDMDGKNLYQTNIEGPVGVVVGNEGNGVSKEVKSIATIKLAIPMQNNLESLNAGVSGSIVMYQIQNKGR